ncbi:DNA repair protein RadC [Nitrospirillum sp. BR 11752]|uniref:RadC family protein n=1 Tax=Nitrospirillum sp. BR 11752 TaxID=3104293 RepID=UPI002EB6AE8E|nr:DNA repair protein RadC [Nitrospirillum sp. BR 11752]
MGMGRERDNDAVLDLDLAAPAAKEPPPHYHGHRDRLRDRFLTQGPEALQDYELVELLLFQAIPRRDVKPLAKQLLGRFGSFWGLVSAPVATLRDEFKLSDAAIGAIKVVAAAALRMARRELLDRPVLSSWEKLLDYCQGALAHEPVEQFRVLFLDGRHALLRDEVQQRGTVNQTAAYPREVLKRALELGASGVILVHNHPSGDPSPSRADIQMTKAIVEAAKALEISVHDHLVIGRGRHFSFRAQGLI